jgi:drug/metabolite transporter (DMT)-like permease
VTHSADPIHRLGPAILGATSFACGDVVSKMALNAGADVLTTVTARSLLGLLLLFVWLQIGSKAAPIPPRLKWISVVLGVVFTANLIFLFKAFELIEVPVAILIYFVYPLLTGLAAAATGLEALTARGLVAAVVAFAGLAVMIGAHPSGLAWVGVAAALASACCRVVMLLITRATLQNADARLVTCYSLIASTFVLVAWSAATLNWQPPLTTQGWLAIVGLAVFTTVGILAVYISAVRIGPFRTALFMNLEPPLTAVGSAIFLGEVLTPLQMLGGAIMLGALVTFQLRR